LTSNVAAVVTVATDVADSQTIDMRAFAMLRYRRHSGSVATLAWFESDSPTGPWVASRANDVAATQSCGDHWNNLTLELAGALYLRAQGNVAGEIKVVKKG
jgi:hypothetical protein